MSRELIKSLQGAQAFDPAPRQNELHLYHVSFDELTDGGDAEASLSRAIRSSERAAVVGRGGQGKSSLIAHATRVQAGIAPFRVPIFVEPNETVTDPKAFAQHLIRTLTTSATQSGLISPEQREAALMASSDRVHILGEEVAHTRSAAEVIAAAIDLVAAIASKEVIPVVVLDDSDGWSLESGPNGSAPARVFFNRVLRIFADFPGALVLAVHEDYLSTPEFQEAESFLETRISIPAFEDHPEQALGHILERRMTVQGLKADSSDVFHEGALEALAHFYREADCNLRKAIWISRAALRYAWVDNAELVTRVHMDAAVAEATEGSYHRARV
jgi:Cdc6-like AAA superfamily ATPase